MNIKTKRKSKCLELSEKGVMRRDEIVGSDHRGPCISHWTFAEKTTRKPLMMSREFQELDMSFTLQMVKVVGRNISLKLL